MTAIIKNETPAKVFSVEFWEILKNFYYVEHLGTPAFCSLEKCTCRKA